MYYVYILRCSDQTLYTGITTDVERRFNEHQKGVGAKYTKAHPPLKVETYFEVDSRSEASKLEYAIKHLSKVQKEILISTKDISILKPSKK